MKQNVITQSNQHLTVVLFAGTLFASATLMFILQPMFGKILLPLLGGTPAVWNTCMVFYQILLFLGYLYAHFLSSRLSHVRQIQIHIGLILISFIALPIGLSENAVPPMDRIHLVVIGHCFSDWFPSSSFRQQHRYYKMVRHTGHQQPDPIIFTLQ